MANEQPDPGSEEEESIVSGEHNVLSTIPRRGGGEYRNHHYTIRNENVSATIILYVLLLIGMIVWFTKAKSKPLEFLFFKRYKNWKIYKTPSSVVYVELEVMKPPPFDSASQYGYFFILDRDPKKID